MYHGKLGDPGLPRRGSICWPCHMCNMRLTLLHAPRQTTDGYYFVPMKFEMAISRLVQGFIATCDEGTHSTENPFCGNPFPFRKGHTQYTIRHQINDFLKSCVKVKVSGD